MARCMTRELLNEAWLLEYLLVGGAACMKGNVGQEGTDGDYYMAAPTLTCFSTVFVTVWFAMQVQSQIKLLINL